MFEKKHIEKYIEEYNIGKLDIQNLIAILISRIQLNQKKRGNVKHIYVNNDKKITKINRLSYKEHKVNT